MATHELTAGLDTVHWGYYDAALPPILTVSSGDRLRVHTESGFLDAFDLVRSRASKALCDIVEKKDKGEGGHMLIGPVAVEGAKAGDVLEVRFLEAAPRYDWGVNVFRPLRGGLPEDFPYHHAVVVEIDKEKGTAHWGAGVNVPLAPFFGNFGVAPPATHQLKPVVLPRWKRREELRPPQDETPLERLGLLPILHAGQAEPDLAPASGRRGDDLEPARARIPGVFRQGHLRRAQEIVWPIAEEAHTKLPAQSVCAHHPAERNATGFRSTLV